MLVKGKIVSGRIPRIRQKIKAPSPHNQLHKRPALAQNNDRPSPRLLHTQQSLSERGLVLPGMETFQRVKTCHGTVYLLPTCNRRVHGELCRYTYTSLSMLYFMLAAPPRSHCDKSILRSYSLPADPLPSTSMFQGICIYHELPCWNAFFTKEFCAIFQYHG